MAEQAASLKVFVSYSRADVAFADQLVLALEDKGFSAILDRHDISGAENWRERLGKLILSADAVAFVLTPKSAASEICAWEVAEALRLGKRIIPVTPANLHDAKPPEALSELNWIPFYDEPAIPGSGFYYGVKRLNEALSVDLDWLRAQTRFSERATEWAKERNEDLLLRGEALREAEAWLARMPRGSNPPDLVREYLAASGDVEQSRVAAAKAQLQEREQALKTAEVAVAENKRTQERMRRFSLWALVAGVLLLAIAIPGNYFAAVRTLDANDRRATLFADAANGLSQKGEYSRALLMALAGDPPARVGLFESLMRPDGNVAVRNALARAYASDRAVASMDVEDATGLATLPDGKRFITVHDSGALMLWTAGETLAPEALMLPKPVSAVYPLPDNDQLVVRWQDSETQPPTQPFAIWSLSQKKVLRDFGPTVSAEKTEWPQAENLSIDSKWLVMADQNANVSVWDVETGELIKSTALEREGFGRIQAIAANAEDDQVVASSDDRVVVWSPGEGKRVGPIRGSFEAINALAYYVDPESLDGTNAIILFGAGQGNVGAVGDDKLGQILQTFAEDISSPEDVTRLRSSKDGRGVLMISEGGQVRLLDVKSVKVTEPFGRQSDVVDAGFLLRAGMLVAVSGEGTVSLASFGRAAPGNSLQSVFGLPESTPSDEFATLMARDGALIGIKADKSIAAWRPGMKAPAQFSLSEDMLDRVQGESMSFSEKSSLLATIDQDKVEIWAQDSKTPKSTLQLGTDDDTVIDAALVADGQALFYHLSSGKAGVVAIDPRADVFPPRQFTDARRLVPSPDGKRIVEITYDLVRVHEAGSDRANELKVAAIVNSATFSPDGKVLVLPNDNGGFELWRPGEARSFQRVKAHLGDISNVAFAPTGDLFATAGSDFRLAVWRLGYLDPVQVFEIPVSAGAGRPELHFAEDGGSVTLASSLGVLNFSISPIFRADVDTQVRMACERLAERGVDGFSDADYNEFSFIGKFDDRRQRSPCMKLGVMPEKPETKPAAPAPAKVTAGN